MVATLITTDPPQDTLIVYTLRPPYIALWGSALLLLSSVALALLDMYALTTFTREWVDEVCCVVFHRYMNAVIVNNVIFLIILVLIGSNDDAHACLDCALPPIISTVVGCWRDYRCYLW